MCIKKIKNKNKQLKIIKFKKKVILYLFFKIKFKQLISKKIKKIEIKHVKK